MTKYMGDPIQPVVVKVEASGALENGITLFAAILGIQQHIDKRCRFWAGTQSGFDTWARRTMAAALKDFSQSLFVRPKKAKNT